MGIVPYGSFKILIQIFQNFDFKSSEMIVSPLTQVTYYIFIDTVSG